MNKIFTALGVLFSLNTLSQTIYFVNDNASGANNGTSWTDAFTKLQDALTAVVSGDQIWVATGIYYPDEGEGLTNDNRSHSFNLKNGVAIFGGFAGTEGQLSERNVTTNVTTLSGEIQQDNDINNNAYNVVQSSSVDNTAVLDGFTITAGSADGEGEDVIGGGIFNNASSPTLTNCSFYENRAFQGGGMYNLSSSPTLTNCSFSGNFAFEIGGGILNLSSTPTMINCSFYENRAFQGGGIFNNASSPILTNCSYSANTAFEIGGGIYNDNSSPTLTNCILWGNSVGEIVNVEGSNPVVTYSIVQGGYEGTGNLDQDPMFVDAANGDLHLQPGSPAIDAGLNSANTTSVDLDGNPRIVNSIIDMGAYEFQGVGIIVSSFTLINADTDEDIRELKDGDVIDLISLPATRLNIRANTHPETVDSVVFELSGLRGFLSYKQTDNTAPYALFSDINGNYLGIIPPPGEYNLKVTPYAESGGSSQPGTSNMITFRVVRTSPTVSLDPKLNVDAGKVKSISLRATPNPFRGVTTISFSVPQSGYTTLEVIDQRGAVLERLYAAQANANQVYTLPFTSKQSNSGVYILRLISGKYVQSYRLVLTQ